MTSSMLDIYKASAGSGKTFLLTVKYLLLLFKNPGTYRQVLAVTFTNKATAEMKERILGELHKLALRNNTPIGHSLIELEAAPDFETLWDLAATIYKQLLHDYSRFNVSTIDSFTQKIIRSCAYELGIDAAFALQMNTEVVKEELANRLFAKIDTPGYEPLRKQLTELATERLEAGKSWDFKQDVKNLAGILFSEAYMEFEAKLPIDPKATDQSLQALRQAVYQFAKQYEQDWKQLSTHGVDLLAANGLAAEDFSYGMSGFGGYFYKAAGGDLRSPQSLTRINDVMVFDKKPYTAKALPMLKDRIESALPAIKARLQLMIDYFDTNSAKYKTANAIKVNLNYLRLVVLMGRELSAWRSENNALLISDTHNLLRQLSAETTPEFIYEKTGNRLQYFLMDEFQDTSTFQYHNFKPLLINSMGTGAYNLVVGDVKQAIYRWRSGNWQLLQEQVPQDFKAFQPQQHNLEYNYRSAKPVIEFNNYLFTLLPQLMQDHLMVKLQAAPDNAKAALQATYQSLLTDAYMGSRQLVPPQASSSGKVTVQFIDVEKEENTDDVEVQGYADVVIAATHQQILKLLGQGYQQGDIAILCRSNNQSRLVIEQLMLLQQLVPDTGYALISADALLIASNTAVQIVIAALQWMLNNGNKIAETILRQAYARYRQAEAADVSIFIPSQSAGTGLPSAFMQEQARLKVLPVIDLVNELIVLFELDTQAEHQPFLLTLLDLVQEWNRFGDAGVHGFLQYWEDEGSTKSLPAGSNANAVEVVTIHKSKGLAYTFVIMPFCNWELEPNAKMQVLVWADMQHTSFAQIPVLPVKYKADLAASELAPYFFSELANGYMDNLNLLYVALTRARTQLFLWAPKPGVDKKGNSKHMELKYIHHLLYAAAVQQTFEHVTDASIPNAFDAETLIWQYGEMTSQQIKPSAQAGFGFLPHYTSWQSERQTALRSADAMLNDETLPRSKGILLHEILAQLHSPGRLALVLKEMEAAGKITQLQSKSYERMVMDILQLTPLADWETNHFSRLAERSFITTSGDLRRPDLILYNNMETRVIDFKFTDDHSNAFKLQVNEYKNWLSQLGFPQIKGFIIYGFSGEYESV